jgi:hypothetical protein
MHDMRGKIHDDIQAEVRMHHMRRSDLQQLLKVRSCFTSLLMLYFTTLICGRRKGKKYTAGKEGKEDKLKRVCAECFDQDATPLPVLPITGHEPAPGEEESRSRNSSIPSSLEFAKGRRSVLQSGTSRKKSVSSKKEKVGAHETEGGAEALQAAAKQEQAVEEDRTKDAKEVKLVARQAPQRRMLLIGGAPFLVTASQDDAARVSIKAYRPGGRAVDALTHTFGNDEYMTLGQIMDNLTLEHSDTGACRLTVAVDSSHFDRKEELAVRARAAPKTAPVAAEEQVQVSGTPTEAVIDAKISSFQQELKEKMKQWEQTFGTYDTVPLSNWDYAPLHMAQREDVYDRLCDESAPVLVPIASTDGEEGRQHFLLLKVLRPGVLATASSTASSSSPAADAPDVPRFTPAQIDALSQIKRAREEYASENVADIFDLGVSEDKTMAWLVMEELSMGPGYSNKESLDKVEHGRVDEGDSMQSHCVENQVLKIGIELLDALKRMHSCGQVAYTI